MQSNAKIDVAALAGAKQLNGGFFFYSRLNPDVEAASDLDAFDIKVTTNAGGIVPAVLTAVGATGINLTSATATATYRPIVCKSAALDDVQPDMMRLSRIQ